ncbi:hypothetical protein SteCoe_16079 [Stentor coeruleus]|uniref:Major facilitator superfamily (MFS) profile domain-containing protein n=1 Tax=Stentor coeruleus TaxID=5963 RepID=A0A1R2C277_9CILI|nr:hypothetical protein SteCoe_16079 [Stentor coeruleus]
MGGFSKTIEKNSVPSWKDSYINYSDLHRKINHSGFTIDINETFIMILTQISQTQKHLATESESFSLSLGSLLYETSPPPSSLLSTSEKLYNLISFSLWNLKIIDKLLIKLEKSNKSSKTSFINQNMTILLSLQSLSSYKDWYSKITQELKKLHISQESTGINEPLIIKCSKKDIETLDKSLEKAGIELDKLEYLSIFPREPDFPDFMTLFLSVFSSFIHLTNFYILTLAAKDYSVYVGMDESFSGVLSAVNWAAAVGFTFVYSYWSNYQYKFPTFICSLFVVLGDFIYFFAYSHKSSAMLLLGRFLIGVGGARVINRRYIATYVKPRSRTVWNSAYVAGSIVGRGMGPVLGALLYYVDFQLFGYNMNGMNFPSLIMGIVWLVYSVMVLMFFKEPEIKKIPKEILKESEGQSLLPMVVTLMALFVPKVVHEAFVTSTPIVAPLYFGWSIEFVGYYIAIMSLAIAPVHIIIAYTSRRFQDRQFIEIALLLTFLGSLLLINFTNFTEIQYILGTILMFIGMNMDDGVTASLLSKVIPPHISEGIFNAGLIVTFAGSFARGVGGFGIAIAGWIDQDPKPMENILFIPLTIISLVSLLIFMKYYNRLDTKLFSK